MGGERLDACKQSFDAVFFPDPERRAQLAAGSGNAIGWGLPVGSGSEADGLRRALESLGIDAEHMLALSLFPLVGVAWADGRFSKGEREVVLEAAHSAGIERGGASHALLDSWLAEPPEAALLDAWQALVAVLAGELSSEHRAALSDRILALCYQVAEATGGFLALDRISGAEYRVLRELRSAFE